MFSKSPVNVLSYFHNLKDKEKKFTFSNLGLIEMAKEFGFVRRR